MLKDCAIPHECTKPIGIRDRAAVVFSRVLNAKYRDTSSLSGNWSYMLVASNCTTFSACASILFTSAGVRSLYDGGALAACFAASLMAHECTTRQRCFAGSGTLNEYTVDLMLSGVMSFQYMLSLRSSSFVIAVWLMRRKGIVVVMG